uniref:pathogen-associated molecular patterns-induced protein A70-like n=1 Tax=Erigeron canadensis TaxID=72917 RepID=UPI001CB9C500|nr:pathogen-associated molecular patterns-induced protein A70-like [Erigeron canadensis]
MTHFDFDPTHEVNRQDSDFEEETDEFESLDDVYSKLKSGGGHVDRSKSDGDFAAKVEARRPATSRKAAAAAMDEEDVHGDDVEVDAKADDFINKFKNDLKLQRIESIMKKNSGKK